MIISHQKFKIFFLLMNLLFCLSTNGMSPQKIFSWFKPPLATQKKNDTLTELQRLKTSCAALPLNSKQKVLPILRTIHENGIKNAQSGFPLAKYALASASSLAVMGYALSGKMDYGALGPLYAVAIQMPLAIGAGAGTFAVTIAGWKATKYCMHRRREQTIVEQLERIKFMHENDQQSALPCTELNSDDLFRKMQQDIENLSHASDFSSLTCLYRSAQERI